jgi:hypothetical protein
VSTSDDTFFSRGYPGAVKVAIMKAADELGEDMEETREQAWARCITELLARHDLGVRQAAAKVGKLSMRSAISDWKGGHVPQYKTAILFLKHFPVDEAVVCLAAAGYPAPPEWIEESDPIDFEALQITLRKSKLSEPVIKTVMREVRNQVIVDAKKPPKPRG